MVKNAAGEVIGWCGLCDPWSDDPRDFCVRYPDCMDCEHEVTTIEQKAARRGMTVDEWATALFKAIKEA